MQMHPKQQTGNDHFPMSKMIIKHSKKKIERKSTKIKKGQNANYWYAIGFIVETMPCLFPLRTSTNGLVTLVGRELPEPEPEPHPNDQSLPPKTIFTSQRKGNQLWKSKLLSIYQIQEWIYNLKNRKAHNKPLKFLVMISWDLHITPVKTVVNEGSTATSWEL